MRLTRPQAASIVSIPILLLALVPLSAPVEARAQDREPAKKDEKEKETEVKKAEGSGAVDVFPKGYLRHDALEIALGKAAEAQPERVRLESLTKTGQGRDVWLVTLGKGEAGTKPAILIVANLEADHVVGSQVALALIERLAGTKGQTTPAASWLDRVTLYVVPRLNPDGAERALNGIPCRTNLRPVDRDRDGRQGEDGPDDLNGDGVLTRMRLKDPRTATLVAEEADPRILRKVDPAKGERAVFSEEDEGFDNDGDGLRNEDPPGGVNLNRNWPQRWTEFDPEAGFSPASEPEVFALISFAFAHPEIAAVWSFGLNDNLREPPAKPDSTLADADLPLFVELSRAFNSATTAKEPPRSGSPASKGASAPGATTDGSISEWAYHQFGALGLASRLWTTPEIPAPADRKEKDKDKEKEKKMSIPEGGEARWLYWNDHVIGGKAFVPFETVDHPTLGKVEVGGWRPGVRLNPPADQVGAIAETHLAFLNELASRLPRLAVPEVKVEAKGGRLFAISAAVANEGNLPTALAQGVRTRKAPPVLVRLVPGKARLLAGRPLERIETLAGSGARRDFSWLIQAPEGVDSVLLQVSCPKGGRVERQIDLK